MINFNARKDCSKFFPILFVLICLVALVCSGQTPAPQKEERVQILTNPDFSLPTQPDGNPPGWFQAMMPNLAIDMKADVGKDDKGQFIYLEQKGVKGNVFNNWAQRIENPPIGRRVQLEAEVSIENAAGKGATIMVMFFDASGKILGGASTEDKFDLTGTKPWTKVQAEGIIPPKCTLAIVRLGLSPGAGKLKVRYARLFLLGGATAPQPAIAHPEQQKWSAGLELLVNGNFEQEVLNDTPVGWFRAMMPNLAIDHKAGIETLPNHGKVVFIEQKGVKSALINNWAQRLEIIPAGARLRLSADVRTENLPENTGFVMMQCWDTKASNEGMLLAAASSQSTQPIGGTADWKTVSMEIVVPEKTDAIIARCGFAQSGKIWFDNVSLKIISPPPAKQADSSPTSEKGFKITEESKKQLEKISELSSKLVELAEKEMGTDAEIRKEIFAHGEGKFEIVLHFSFSYYN